MQHSAAQLQTSDGKLGQGWPSRAVVQGLPLVLVGLAMCHLTMQAVTLLVVQQRLLWLEMGLVRHPALSYLHERTNTRRCCGCSLHSRHLRVENAMLCARLKQAYIVIDLCCKHCVMRC